MRAYPWPSDVIRQVDGEVVQAQEMKSVIVVIGVTVIEDMMVDLVDRVLCS